jgi:ankyrin repeat protein
VLYQYRDIADVLLRQGVAVDTSSALTGRTPLLDAVMNGDSRTVDMLLQYSADPTLADKVSDADVSSWLFCGGAVLWVDDRSYNHVLLVSNLYVLVVA